jgi:acetyltransferase-like isoleucine patch superfamily enzyme
MKTLLRALVVLLPWRLRRLVLQRLYGFRLHAESRIGLAWIFPRELVMERGASIGHFTVAKGMDRIAMGERSHIGRLNWISAFPTGTGSAHFAHLRERVPQLVLGEHASITNRHIVDCTERVEIGRFATVAGFRSQILTHSIDLEECRQDARPVTIGDFCFVGTACTILGGAVLPHHSILGAHALLKRAFQEPYRLYAGVPAVAAGEVCADLKYFTRTEGYVI